MRTDKWLKLKCASLLGKRIAITGTTGGIGRELCDILASCGAQLILMDRNRERSSLFADELREKYGTDVQLVSVDLADFHSVVKATDELLLLNPDCFIHNAGAYSIPRYKTNLGYDNVFQINFISPYYIIKRLLPHLKSVSGRAVAVGSIAHNYSRSDENDVDFSTRKQSSKVYGNAKRYLMFSLHELFKNEKEATLSIVHPGISFTGITNHYPKLIFALIKHPMKVIFMNPRRAALSVVDGVFRASGYCEWTGPRIFDVWGVPKKKLLRTASSYERETMFATAEKIYSEILSVE